MGRTPKSPRELESPRFVVRVHLPPAQKGYCSTSTIALVNRAFLEGRCSRPSSFEGRVLRARAALDAPPSVPGNRNALNPGWGGRALRFEVANAKEAGPGLFSHQGPADLAESAQTPS